jgi:Cft2 family RNA processing exonuclease
VPLVTLTRYGLYSPAADLHLDARSAPGAVYVSHAHSDHCTEANKIVCTPETGALHRARRGCRAAIEIPYEKPTAIGDATAVLTPAGHTLGSSMITIYSDEGTLAYTGDYKLRDNPFSRGATIPRCDTLVMECTFGEPRYTFPPDDELLTKLIAFIEETRSEGATPVLLAYALGKGQEVLYHLTSRGYNVMLHGAIANMCQLHVELDYPFPGPGTWTRYRRGEIGNNILLTTPGTRRTAMVQQLPKKRICYLTGWALHPGAFNIYKDCDLVLPLSDHADWNELTRTAVESGASKVYTVHGHNGLARHLCKMGIDADHLADHPSFNELGEDEPLPTRPRRDDDQHSLEF